MQVCQLGMLNDQKIAKMMLSVDVLLKRQAADKIWTLVAATKLGNTLKRKWSYIEEVYNRQINLNMFVANISGHIELNWHAPRGCAT